MVGMLQFKKVHNLLVIVILQGLVSRLISTIIERERRKREKGRETEKHVMLLTI